MASECHSKGLGFQGPFNVCKKIHAKRRAFRFTILESHFVFSQRTFRFGDYNFFEENGTAYYVMEYHDGGSLGSLPLPLAAEEASVYIRQVASALSYLHDRNTMHLDVKPSNVLIDKEGNAVLIDFGISKHYDYAGHQTSSTPIGISKGYAPIEQYSQSTLEFNPATDIYSLGATLYKLLTGDTPQEASLLVSNPKLLTFPSSVSEPMAALIRRCMSPSLDARPQSIADFLGLLDDALAAASVIDDTLVESEGDDDTVVSGSDRQGEDNDGSGKKEKEPSSKKKSRKWLWWLLAAVLLVGIGTFFAKSLQSGSEASETVRPVPQHEIDKAAYDSWMAKASAIALTDLVSCNEAVNLYKEASVYEEKYKGTKYASMFSGGAAGKISSVESRITKLKEEKARDEEAKAKAAQAKKQYEADLKDYNDKIAKADSKSRSDEKSLKEAKKLYEEAAKYETKYKGTEYASSFGKGAASRAKDMQSLIDNLQKSKSQPATSPSPKTPTVSKTGSHSGHEWVDLGLSVKWATCNVGASTPGDYGNYYAWGETSTKTEYYSSNSASYGKSWSDIGGSSSRDAARANWGGSWRLPTRSEFQELIDNCTWTWTEQNGHKGYKVTSKKNSQSIFLPAAGYRRGDTLYYDGEYGDYWSSTPNESGDNDAYGLYFNEGSRGVNWSDRNSGRSVRPVLED